MISNSPSDSVVRQVAEQSGDISSTLTQGVNDREFALLDGENICEDLANEHSMSTAPLMSRDAFVEVGFSTERTQYGLLGSIMSVNGNSQHEYEYQSDRRVYVNTNAPFSAVVCGVQGSGKSHTVATLLESMLIEGQPEIGILRKPLSGLVFQYGEGGPSARASEAASLGLSSAVDVASPRVKVFCSRSSLHTMRRAYAHLGPGIVVEPLHFTSHELDAEALLSMMAVGSAESAPLYMHLVLSIVRDMGEAFDYERFQRLLDEQSFTPQQLASLKQRLALLDSFVDRQQSAGWSPRFAEGQITIIDLSDPFIDPTSACSLFEIIVRLFVRADIDTGKVLLVDEAHKYLSRTRSSAGLTKALLSLVRQQRHLAMRILVSTQEPTAIPPVLLDLCTVTILHRFSSPSWWKDLAEHTSAAFSDDTFDQVVRLKTGQAMIMAPSALIGVRELNSSEQLAAKVDQLARRFLVVKIRRRITVDDGASVMAINSP